ncbi:MAG: hypothetical protein M1832_001153 [Thelocarpon impressellum]|nr:MAG: hypothetical protein M1832_001153 [Thelocarpon impressellum]
MDDSGPSDSGPDSAAAASLAPPGHALCKAQQAQIWSEAVREATQEPAIACDGRLLNSSQLGMDVDPVLHEMMMPWESASSSGPSVHDEDPPDHSMKRVAPVSSWFGDPSLAVRIDNQDVMQASSWEVARAYDNSGYLRYENDGHDPWLLELPQDHCSTGGLGVAAPAKTGFDQSLDGDSPTKRRPISASGLPVQGPDHTAFTACDGEWSAEHDGGVRPSWEAFDAPGHMSGPPLQPLEGDWGACCADASGHGSVNGVNSVVADTALGEIPDAFIGQPVDATCCSTRARNAFERQSGHSFLLKDASGVTGLASELKGVSEVSSSSSWQAELCSQQGSTQGLRGLPIMSSTLVSSRGSRIVQDGLWTQPTTRSPEDSSTLGPVTSPSVSSQRLVELAVDDRDGSKERQGRPSGPACNGTTSTRSTTPQRASEKDAFLVRSRQAGISYKEIRQRGNFSEKEPTLRGRFRTLTKQKQFRVRKPTWESRDECLLLHAVDEIMEGPGRAAAAGTRGGVTEVSRPAKIPWKQVADYIFRHGGSYHFGNATCSKKWHEIHGLEDGKRR